MAEVETMSRVEVDLTEPKNYNVILHNDNTTEIGFVISLLMTTFKKTETEARNIAQTIDNAKAGVAGTYIQEIAAEKVEESLFYASRAGFSEFKVTMEEE